MSQSTSKQCTRCGEDKVFSAYSPHPRGKFGLQSRCKACVAALNAERYHANIEVSRRRSRESAAKYRREKPEQAQAAKRRWKEANPQWFLRDKLRQYGLTPDDFERMRRVQLDACAVCGCALLEPHIDHDHGTGVVRGLLCQLCNRGLGHFNDSPQRLEAAANYLRRHGKT